VSFTPLGELPALPQHLLAGFEGPLRGGGKESRKIKKERDRRDGRKHPNTPPEINFWLRPWTGPVVISKTDA